MKFQRRSIWLPGGERFEMYPTGMFAVTANFGEARENVHGTRVRSREVRAAGRAVSSDALRIGRGKWSATKLRDALSAAGWALRVTRVGKRR